MTANLLRLTAELTAAEFTDSQLLPENTGKGNSARYGAINVDILHKFIISNMARLRRQSTCYIIREKEVVACACLQRLKALSWSHFGGSSLCPLLVRAPHAGSQCK